MRMQLDSLIKGCLCGVIVLTVVNSMASENKWLAKMMESVEGKASKHMGTILGEGPLSSLIFEKLNSYTGKARDSRKPTKEMAALDKQWVSWYNKLVAFNTGMLKQKPVPPAFAANMINSGCSKKLKEFLTANAGDLNEIFVMDASGAVVCAADYTSDYDQGDEDKWAKPFLEGISPFGEKPEIDKSTKAFQTKVSFLIQKNGKNLGVISFGFKPVIDSKSDSK